jgi:hypothetical protein
VLSCMHTFVSQRQQPFASGLSARGLLLAKAKEYE